MSDSENENQDWEDEGSEGEQQFKASVYDYERTGMGDLGASSGDGLQRYKFSQNPVDRFKEQVGAVLSVMVQMESIKVTYEIKDDLISAIDKLHSDDRDVGGKNATAFILGYIVSRRGAIDQSLVNKIFDIIPNIHTESPIISSVSNADVIRYARLWLSLK